MQQRQPEAEQAKERAVGQVCEGLRALHSCGFTWSAVRKRVLHFVMVMAGDESDTAKMKAVADAAETAYHKKTTKRKPAKKRAKKTK